MLRFVGLLIVIFATILELPGCGDRSSHWEVTAKNQSDGPCSFFVTLGSDGNTLANVENVGKGETLPMIVGSTTTVVQTVKVVRGEEKQTLTPKTELPVGKRFAIIVDADGKVRTAVTDR